MISNVLCNFINYSQFYSQFFLTKLLTLRILFPTGVRTVVVAELVILGISPLTSFILASRKALVAKLVIVILGISSLTSFI